MLDPELPSPFLSISRRPTAERPPLPTKNPCLVGPQVRSQAEEAIKAVAKKPEIVMQLVQKISSSPSPEVRQLSAVLLRKKITSLWRKLDDQV